MKKIVNSANRQPFWILLLLVLSVPAVFRIIGPGFFSLHDDLHVAWLFELDRALRLGQFPPRWAPDLSWGYGYPLFVFVYPLPFYLGEIFHLLGLTFVGSIKAVLALSVLLSGPSMFLFARRHFSLPASLSIALLYVYTPYRAVEVYVRGAIGEALIFVFIPLVFYFVDRLIEQPRRLSNILGTAVGLALLVLCHNIGAYMVLPFIFLYILFKVATPKKLIAFGPKLIAATALAAVLSCYFWLPALVEKQYMVADTVFNYFDHFPFIKQLLLPSWGYGISTWGPYDGLSFQIGLVNLLSVVIGFIGGIGLIINKKNSRLFLFLIFAFSICLFLMNIRSSFLWQNIPLLTYFQFPWRFLIMTTFIGSLCLGFIDHLPVLSPKVRRLGIFTIPVLAMVLTFSNFKPELVFPDRTDNYYLKKYTPLLGSQDCQQNTEEYLRLPLWTLRRPSSLPQNRITAKNLTLFPETANPLVYSGQVVATQAGQIKLAHYFFPGWTATLDNRPQTLSIDPQYGTMSLEVVPGQSRYKFRFGESSLRLGADLVSAVGWLTVLVFVLKLIYVRSRFKSR